MTLSMLCHYQGERMRKPVQDFRWDLLERIPIGLGVLVQAYQAKPGLREAGHDLPERPLPLMQLRRRTVRGALRRSEQRRGPAM
jgi:hypothetical protein